MAGCATPAQPPPPGVLGVYQPAEAVPLRYDDGGSGLSATVIEATGGGWRWVAGGAAVATLRREGLEEARAAAKAALRNAQERVVNVESSTRMSSQRRWLERQRVEADRAAAQAAVNAWERGGRSDAVRESELAVRELALVTDRLEQQWIELPAAKKLSDPDDRESEPTREARLLRQAWSIATARADIEGHRHERRLREDDPRPRRGARA